MVLIAVVGLCTLENDVIHAAYLAIALLLFRRRDTLRTERHNLFKWLPLYNFAVMLLTLLYQSPFEDIWGQSLGPSLVCAFPMRQSSCQAHTVLLVPFLLRLISKNIARCHEHRRTQLLIVSQSMPFGWDNTKWSLCCYHLMLIGWLCYVSGLQLGACAGAVQDERHQRPSVLCALPGRSCRHGAVGHLPVAEQGLCLQHL